MSRASPRLLGSSLAALPAAGEDQAGSSSLSAGAMASSSFDVDDVITKLLEVRGSRPGKQVNLTETEIRGLCTGAREIFMSQPVLLELEAPIKICGARRRHRQRRRRRRSAAAPPPPLRRRFALRSALRALARSPAGSPDAARPPRQATCTASTSTCCASSSTAASRPSRTTCSSATTSTAASRASRRSACCSRTR